MFLDSKFNHVKTTAEQGRVNTVSKMHLTILIDLTGRYTISDGP